MQDLVIKDIYKKLEKNTEENESLKAKLIIYLEKTLNLETDLKELKASISSKNIEIYKIKEQTEKYKMI